LDDEEAERLLTTLGASATKDALLAEAPRIFRIPQTMRDEFRGEGIGQATKHRWRRATRPAGS